MTSVFIANCDPVCLGRPCAVVKRESSSIHAIQAVRCGARYCQERRIGESKEVASNTATLAWSPAQQTARMCL